MYKALKEIKDTNSVGDFLFPSLPRKIKGKVGYLADDMVVIESENSGQVYQYLAHPNNVCIVQKKSD